MYRLVAEIDPDTIESVAAQLFVEMLEAGYTSAGEFHYLHHDRDGRPYASLTETSERIIAAAERTGIALTLLPVLYTSAGFGGEPPAPGQRRFVNDVERYAQLLETLFSRHRHRTGLRIGAAPHSLRAVTPEELREALRALGRLDARAPVHIHVAEQIREVEDCVRWCGQRPVEWLLEHARVDERWCLVHATHLTNAECAALAASEATVGLCPTTEANPRRRLLPRPRIPGRRGTLRHRLGQPRLRESLRGAALARVRPAPGAPPPCCARHGRHSPRSDARSTSTLARNGARALGLATGALAPGRRADLIAIDTTLPALEGRFGDELLDALVFAGNVNPVRDVMVGGRWQVREGRHRERDPIRRRFAATLRAIRAR